MYQSNSIQTSMNQKQNYTHRITNHIVQDFMDYLIKDNVTPRVKQIIKTNKKNHLIKTIGLKKVTDHIFPQLLQQIDFQQLGAYDDVKFFQKHSIEQNKNFKRMYRRSCDDINQFRQSKTSQRFKNNYLWLRELQQNVRNKKNDEIFAQRINSKMKTTKTFKTFKNLKTQKVIKNKCSPDQAQSQKRYSQNYQAYQQSPFIKIAEQIQNQDPVIHKQRQKYLKKQAIQKEFQLNFDQQGQQGRTEEYNLKLPHQLINCTVSNQFTTDYDGSIIDFQNVKNKNYITTKKDKKQSLNKDKMYQSAQNSPRKYSKMKSFKKINFDTLQRNEQLQANNQIKDKMKIKFKVKKQTIIDPLVNQQSKLFSIKFQTNQNQDQQVGSGQPKFNQNTPEFQGKNSQIKSSKMFSIFNDHKSPLNQMDLSPGVTVEGFFPSRQNHQQNDFEYKIPTAKSIRKSIKCSNNVLQEIESNIKVISKKLLRKHSTFKKLHSRNFSFSNVSRQQSVQTQS